MERTSAAMPLFAVICLFGLLTHSFSAQAAYDEFGNLVAPEVSLSASSKQVVRGDPVTLMWRATHVSSCSASGSWSGNKPVRDSLTIDNLQKNSVFTLNCVAGRDQYKASVSVEVIENDEVSVTLTAQPQAITAGDSVTLSWDAAKATHCAASGDWFGDQPVRGSKTLSDLASTSNFSLSCSTSTSNALASVTVPVSKAETAATDDASSTSLRWRIPTTDESGKPLQQLAGYRVYWGRTPGLYTNEVYIDNPRASVWLITAEPGDYYFAMTAITRSSVESDFSNEVFRSVTGPIIKKLAKATAPADQISG